MGIKHTTDGEINFPSIPVEASARGSFATIYNSEGITTNVSQQGNRIRIQHKDQSLELNNTESDEMSVSHHIESLGEDVVLNFSAHNYGKREVIWHESDTVFPVNQGTEKMIQQMGSRTAPPQVQENVDGNNDVFIISGGE